MDDQIVLIGLILASTKLTHKVGIAVGTVLGVCLMFGLATLVPVLFAANEDAFLGMQREDLRFLGMIPIGLGLWQLVSTARSLTNGQDDDEEAEIKTYASAWAYTIAAFAIYFGNSMDDLIVTVSALASADTVTEGAWLFVGIQLGCLTSIGVATGLSRVLARWQTALNFVAGLLLIVIGTLVIVNN